ncbi:MAG TPA: hypothetical protein VF881_09560 [Polyangiaceae bacterium]
MNRSLCAVMLLLSVAGACGDSDKEKLKRQADERVAQAEKDAKEKVAAAERKVEELEAQLVDAGAQVRAEAEEEVSKAKTEADKLASDATHALAKARAAYKESERRELNTAMKDVDEIKAKAASAQPKVKTQVDTALKDVAVKKEALRKEIDGFDKATLENLRTVKAKADKALVDLKKSIHTARSKLP